MRLPTSCIPVVRAYRVFVARDEKNLPEDERLAV